MSKPSKNKRSLGSRIVSWIFTSLIVVMLAFEGYGLISARANYGVPNYFGYQFFTVLTDSMDTGPETFPVGIGIIVKKTDPETLVASSSLDAHDGDIITFYRQTDRRIVTHRIIEIDSDAQGLVFIALGDNLNADTCPTSGCTAGNADRVPEADILGKVINKSAFLGATYRFMSHPATMLLLVLLPLGVLVVLSAIDFVKAMKHKETVPASVKFTKEDMEAIKEEARKALLDDLKSSKKEEPHNEE